MKMRLLALGLATSLAMPGCAPVQVPTASPLPSIFPPDPAVFAVPVHDTSGALMEAVVIGSLEFDGACFYAQTPRIGRFTVIWPDGFVGRRVAASAELVDPSGPVYKVGDVLRVGGGAFETPPFSDVLTQAHGSLTPVCQVPPYWIGGPVSRD